MYQAHAIQSQTKSKYGFIALLDVVIVTVDIGHEIPFQSQFAMGIVSFLGREKVFSKSVVLGKSIVSVENYTYKDM